MKINLLSYSIQTPQQFESSRLTKKVLTEEDSYIVYVQEACNTVTDCPIWFRLSTEDRYHSFLVDRIDFSNPGDVEQLILYCRQLVIFL